MGAEKRNAMTNGEQRGIATVEFDGQLRGAEDFHPATPSIADDEGPINYPCAFATAPGPSRALTEGALAMGALEAVPIVRQGRRGAYCTFIVTKAIFAEDIREHNRRTLPSALLIPTVTHADGSEEQVVIRRHLL